MKKLLVLLTFLGLGVFISCTKDSATTNGAALTVTSDAATHYTGESFKFTVTAPDGTDVSSQAAITVSSTPITGNTFYSLTAGTFTVTATYAGTTSKSIQVTVTENPVPLTSMTVTPSSTNVYTGDVVTFTVAGNNNSNLTQACTIFVNGTQITGNTYTATTAGPLDVYAVYPSSTPVTSSTLNLTIAQAINFQKRVLIEDYTGQWCGWCPRVAYSIGLVEKQTTFAVPVAIHVAGGSTEPDAFDGGAAAQTLGITFGVNSFPTGKLNRTTTWTSLEPNHLQQVLDLVTGANPRVGLAMTTSLSSDGSSANVAVKVKFGQNFSNLKLVVYALEDKLSGNQRDYTNYYGGNGNQTIPNFAYDNVFRASLTTSVLGDNITGNTNLNDEYTQSYTYTVPAGVNAANVHFVAFVVDSSKKALNVRNASNTEVQDYETLK